MSSKTYRSSGAAERGVAAIMRAVPSAKCKRRGAEVTVYARSALLTPSEREALDRLGIDPVEPRPPSPAKPLFTKGKTPRPPSEVSLVDNAMQVCREVFGKFHEEGRIDARLDAIDEAVSRGVARSTAASYYPRVRVELGLPASLRADRRIRARRGKPVNLSGHAPTVGFKVQNGETQPASGTIKAEVWTMADVLRKRLGRTPKRGEVRERLPHVNEFSLPIYYKSWRRFHGLAPAGQHHQKKENP